MIDRMQIIKNAIKLQTSKPNPNNGLIESAQSALISNMPGRILSNFMPVIIFSAKLKEQSKLFDATKC